jgi:hypothetical protein
MWSERREKRKKEELRKETSGFQKKNGCAAVSNIPLLSRLVFLKSVYGFLPQLFTLLSSLFTS